MLNKYFYISLLLTFLFYLSCSDEPTSSEEIETGTVTDIDGNVYQTRRIGNQWWMAENLKVTHYRNGDVIPNVTDSATWLDTYTGAYCNFDYSTFTTSTYGRLYNWYAVDDSRKIAPSGWHVASDEEWHTLVDYLGGDSLAAGEMKSTSGWYNNGNGSNSSGFSALPGGYREANGTFYYLGLWSNFWSSTEFGNDEALFRCLNYEQLVVYYIHTNKKCGFSVRCIRD